MMNGRKDNVELIDINVVVEEDQINSIKTQNQDKETLLKGTLYKLSAHLHPRIIESISFNDHQGSLKINLKQNVPSALMDILMKDFQDFLPKQDNSSLTITIPNTNLETFSKKLEFYALNKKEKGHFKMARIIKEVTDRFDCEIIEPKPSGTSQGVKLGGVYLKKINLNKRYILEFFTYKALHRFLGTKSPQMDLMKTKNNDLWMASMNLTQTYTKHGQIKNKEFKTLKDIPSFQLSFSRKKPTINTNEIDMKSVGKIILLAILFRFGDLHTDNLGIINSSKKKDKLSIVDLIPGENKLSDFTHATSWKSLLDLLSIDFEKANEGIGNIIPTALQLIDKLKNDIPSFLEAIDAIFYPLTENKLKNKNIFFINNGQHVIEERSKTFIDTVRKSYLETLEEFRKLDIDTDDDTLNIKKILDERMTLILEGYMNLEFAVNSLKSLNSQPEDLTKPDPCCNQLFGLFKSITPKKAIIAAATMTVVGTMYLIQKY